MSSLIKGTATSILGEHDAARGCTRKDRFNEKGSPLTLSDVANALPLLDPSMCREQWVRLAAALYSEFGDDAYDVYEQWSANGNSYSPRDFHSMWKSLSKFDRISIGSFLHAVLQAGWRRNIENASRVATSGASQSGGVHRKVSEPAAHGTLNRLLDRLVQMPIASADHPYLLRKRIRPFNLRQDERNRLVVPITSGRDLMGLQFISATGQKWYLPGSQKTGNFYPVGSSSKAPLSAPTIGICEGVATGHSLHQTLVIPIFCAMDAGNLSSVARVLRTRFTGALLTIYADNDAQEVGQRKAREAAASVSGDARVRMPPKRGSDWNDFVNEQIESGATV